MYRTVIVLSAVLLLDGGVRADTIVNTYNSSFAATNELYGAPFSSNVGVGAFGQVFSLEEDAKVSSFSFYLNNSEGGTTQRRYTKTPRFIGYLMEWDPLDQTSGSAKLTDVGGQATPLFASQTVGIVNGYRYEKFTVDVPDVELKAGTEYVAFFSAFDAMSNLAGLARVAGAATGLDIEGMGVVSNSTIATQFAHLYSRQGAFTSIGSDMAIVIEGAIIAGTNPVVLHGPEPASFIMWSLLGCIGMAFGWRRWRRRRSS